MGWGWEPESFTGFIDSESIVEIWSSIEVRVIFHSFLFHANECFNFSHPSPQTLLFAKLAFIIFSGILQGGSICDILWIFCCIFCAGSAKTYDVSPQMIIRILLCKPRLQKISCQYLLRLWRESIWFKQLRFLSFFHRKWCWKFTMGWEQANRITDQKHQLISG